jgi:hypothetical protein
MAPKNNSDPQTPGEDTDENDDDVEIPGTGEAIVKTSKQPPRAPKDKTIHPRRPLPPVPEADD